MQQKKITLATLKSFLRKNEGKLYINQKTNFDSMVDGCVSCNGGFKPAEKTAHSIDYTLGYKNIWVVGRSNDFFKPYEDPNFEGIEVSNCCGRFIVAIKK